MCCYLFKSWLGTWGKQEGTSVKSWGVAIPVPCHPPRVRTKKEGLGWGERRLQMCSGWGLLDGLIRSKRCHGISSGAYLSFPDWFWVGSKGKSRGWGVGGIGGTQEQLVQSSSEIQQDTCQLLGQLALKAWDSFLRAFGFASIHPFYMKGTLVCNCSVFSALYCL